RDAVLPEVGQRVDVRAERLVGTDLEVQVGPGGVAGRAGAAELLAGADRLAGGHRDRRQVRVLAVPAVGVTDDHLVAERAGPAGGDHLAGRDGLDGGAGGHGEVHARVVPLGPQVAGGAVRGAGAGGDRRGVPRRRLLRGR